MTALIIVAAVLVFLAVLIFLPVSVKLIFKDEFHLLVKFGYIITLYNSDKQESHKKETPEKAAFQTEVEKNKVKRFFEAEIGKYGVRKFLKVYGKIAIEVLKKLLRFIKKLKIKVFKFNLSVATDNAFDTALEYGEVCTAVYPVISFICSNAKVKFKEINITSDFINTDYDFSTEISLKTSFIVAFLMLVSLYKIYGKIKSGELIAEEGNSDE